MKLELFLCLLVPCLLKAVLSAPTKSSTHLKDAELDAKRLEMALRLILVSDFLERVETLELAPDSPRVDRINKAWQIMNKESLSSDPKTHPTGQIDTKESVTAELTNTELLEDIKSKLAATADNSIDMQASTKKETLAESKTNVKAAESTTNGRDNVNSGDILVPTNSDATENIHTDISSEQRSRHHDKVSYERPRRELMKEIEELLTNIGKPGTYNTARSGTRKLEKKDFAILPPASEWCRMMGFWRCGGNSS